MSGFFTRKSESLAQSFVDTIFKGIVSTLVIGSLATLIGWKVSQQIEVYEKRQALRVLQNEALQTAIKSLSLAFGPELACARQNALVKTPECRTELNAYSVRLNSERSVLLAVADLPSTDPLDRAIKATDALVNVATGAGDVRPQIVEFTTATREALAALAREFR